jgi:hypothetical protein
MPEFMVAIDHMTYYAVQSQPSIWSSRVRGEKCLPRRAMPLSASMGAASPADTVPSGRTGEALLEASHALVAGDGTCPAGLFVLLHD